MDREHEELEENVVAGEDAAVLDNQLYLHLRLSALHLPFPRECPSAGCGRMARECRRKPRSGRESLSAWLRAGRAAEAFLVSPDPGHHCILDAVLPPCGEEEDGSQMD